MSKRDRSGSARRLRFALDVEYIEDLGSFSICVDMLLDGATIAEQSEMTVDPAALVHALEQPSEKKVLLCTRGDFDCGGALLSFRRKRQRLRFGDHEVSSTTCA